ncbi:MAG TPA: site-specific integrase [Bacteroidales bacterium]|nr:site-specific integrase [Bacteroidales bacterium]
MKKRTTLSLLFFVKRTKLLKNGEAPVYMRITIMGERLDLALNRSVNLKIWSSEKGACVGITKESRMLNQFIESIRGQIYQIVNDLKSENRQINLVAIKNAYFGIEIEEDKGKKIIELFREHNDKIKMLVNIDFSPETIERYETCLKHTQNFIRQKYNCEDLYLFELDHEFITDYEIYFKTVRKCSHNTTMKYIKNFKKIVRLAITNGQLNKDPFANYKMRLKKIDRGFLSDEELKTIIDKKFSTNRLEQVRDCFVFSCFTGLAHSDLKRLSREHVVTGTDGGKWIKINRKKTDNLSSIPILDVTQKILDKYKYDPYCLAHNVLLPVNSNQKMNAYLKEIADLCGIEKNFTSHLARHTFATTVTLNNNVPIETVSKMLGHSSINMTKIYARLLDKKVGQDMKHLNKTFVIDV